MAKIVKFPEPIRTYGFCDQCGGESFKLRIEPDDTDIPVVLGLECACCGRYEDFTIS